MATVKYLKPEKAYLYKNSTGSSHHIELLWGDRIELAGANKVNGRYKVKTRGRAGYVDADDLQDEALLEYYIIDVGQGDGILIVTPNRKHILIDGGYVRSSQPHGKNAADFVDWKFYKDYGEDTIDLDDIICSHCDADHYGGLWDLLNPEEDEELDAPNLSIKNFYHAGVSWWESDTKKHYVGNSVDGFLVNLLEGNASINDGLDENSPLRLQGNWAKFMKTVQDSGAHVSRLAFNPAKGIKCVPGYETDKDVSIKILGPVESTVNNKPVLKDFGNNSKNTNGNSILLRIDYGRSRILLTGDLNKKSQRYILDNFVGKRLELAADVVKSCHHGSDDCSFEFLECVNAAATVISSGDDESHAHPRPNIVAASGIAGYKKVHNDELTTPLIFSTEISRSLKLGDPYKVQYDGYHVNANQFDVTLTDEWKTKISYKRTTSGALHASDKISGMNRLKVVDGIVYGLVNIRTDGNKILCATLNEGKSKWEIKTFYSRF